MNNKIKMAVAAIGFSLTATSSITLAGPAFPDPITECVEQGMRNYCKSIGQSTSCAVPIHIYYEIRMNCY
jgi:hypothetical protein